MTSDYKSCAVPELCGNCHLCQREREDILSKLIPAMKQAGRIIDEQTLNALPVRHLHAMLIRWTEPQFVW